MSPGYTRSLRTECKLSSTVGPTSLGGDSDRSSVPSRLSVNASEPGTTSQTRSCLQGTCSTEGLNDGRARTSSVICDPNHTWSRRTPLTPYPSAPHRTGTSWTGRGPSDRGTPSLSSTTDAWTSKPVSSRAPVAGPDTDR